MVGLKCIFRLPVIEYVVFSFISLTQRTAELAAAVPGTDGPSAAHYTVGIQVIIYKSD